MDQPITPTPPVFTHTPIEPEPPKKSYTWLIVIVIIILLVTASTFAYQNFKLKRQLKQSQLTPLVSPSPAAETANPTANWKTYTNKNLNLEFKYPPDYSIIDEGKSFVSIGPGVRYFSVSSDVKDYSKVSSCYPDRYPTGYQQTYPCLCQGVILGPNNDWEELKFKNAESFCVDEGKEGLHAVEILQIYATPKIEIRLFDPFRSHDQDEVNDLFDQILSTFKFTN